MKTKRIFAQCLALCGMVSIFVSPSFCDDPRVIVIGQPQTVYLENGRDCPTSTNFSTTATGYVSWKITGGPCATVGIECNATKSGNKTHSFFREIEEGRYYQGQVALVLRAPGTIPTCQGSIPPSCPATDDHVYMPFAELIAGPTQIGDCYCADGQKYYEPD